MKQISKTTKGIILIISSAFCFAMMAVFVRLAGDIHFIQKGFFRNSIAFLISLGSILFEVKKNGKESIAIPKGAMLYLFLRSITGSVGIFGNFYAVDRLVLSDAAILNKMAPFMAIVASFFLMKEKIKPIPLVAIIVAFLGAMLVVKPSFDFSQTLPTLVGFAGGMGAGFAYACVRKLSTIGCKGKVIVCFFSCFSMLLSVPYMFINFNPMTPLQVFYLVMSGVCAAGGQFTITAAYYHAPASKISIYDYSQIIFSTLLGYFIFGMVPDYLSIIGYAVIVAMAALNFFYNRRELSREEKEITDGK